MAGIVITGLTQCGKTIVMSRIAQVLKEEFGAIVVAPQLEKQSDFDMNKLQNWEKELVKKEVWHLKEINISRA